MQMLTSPVRRQPTTVRWLLIPLILATFFTAFMPAFSPTLRAGAAVQSTTATPALLYSSYLGGDGAEDMKDIAVDGEGNIYVIGQTYSDVLLGYEIERKGHSDLFVAKFDPTGTQLRYLTLLGGNDTEIPMAIEVDAQGNAYGTSVVFDDTFPTKNALWPSPGDTGNSVLFKLDGAGELVYSTYLLDQAESTQQNLVVDAAGNAYVVGTRWGVQEGETFLWSQMSLLKLDPSGTQLLLDRHVGGAGWDYGSAVAVDGNGIIYLAGSTESDVFPVTDNALQSTCGEILHGASYCGKDAVVVVLSPAGETLYASYHGGNATDEAKAIATDGQGNIALAGKTISGQFPLVNALQPTCPEGDDDRCYLFRGYVSMFNLEISRGAIGQASLVYSTYLGASERNSISDVLDLTMDSAGHAYVVGYTNGKNFPTQNPVQANLTEGFCSTFGSARYCFDGFLTQFSPTGELMLGSYLGGAFDEYPYGVVVDAEGTIYMAGTTESFDYPTTENAFQRVGDLGDEGFVAKIGEGDDAPTATPSGTPSTTPSGTPSTTPSTTPSVTTTPDGTPTTVTPQTTETPQTTGTPQVTETPEPTVTLTLTPQASQTPQVTPQSASHHVRLPSVVR